MTASFVIMLVGFAVVSFIQNMAFTWSSRSRNSGDPSYHRKASWASNGIYYLTNALLTVFIVRTQVWWMLGVQGLVYTVSTAEGSVLMMKRLLTKEQGKRAVGAGKYAQITVEEWERVKYRALTLDLGDGKSGTFTVQDLVELKKLAQGQQDLSLKLTLDTSLLDRAVERAKSLAQPGPVEVSNDTITKPPAPIGSQHARL